MTTQTNNTVTTFNGATVTVIAIRGSWTEIQLSNGSTKKVRNNVLVTQPIVTNDQGNNTMTTQQTTLSTAILSVSAPEENNMTNMFATYDNTNDNVDLQEQLWILDILKEVVKEDDDKVAAEFKYACQSAFSMVRAVRLFQLAEATNSDILAHQALRGVLEFTRSWKGRYTVKTLTPVSDTAEYREGRKNREMYFRDTLVWLINEGTTDLEELLSVFDWGVANILNKFRCMTDEEIDSRKNAYSQRNKGLTYIPEVTGQPVAFRVTSNALLMSVRRGAEFKVGNSIITIKRDQRFSITIGDMANDIFKAMERVNIHAKVTCQNGNEKPFDVIAEESLDVEGSPLNKLFLLKNNRISIDKLFTSDTKEKVVSVDPIGRIKDVAYPSKFVRGVYGSTGLVSTAEAQAGYVDATRDVAALVQFVGGGRTRMALTVDAINKVISRNDKQEKITWAIGKHRVFVPADVTSPEDFNDFGPGPFIVTESFINKYGLCRITSPMIEGGVKAVTNYHDSNKEGHLILSPNAFKGGLTAALMLLGAPIDNIATLAVTDTKNMVAFMKDNLASIEFNGRTLEGFFVDVELNISNAYLVEQYKFKGENLDKQDTIEEMVAIGTDIMEHTNKTPSALRNMIMHRVVNDTEFEVVPFLKSMLDNEVIIAKQLVTRHTASVFQSMAQWHGVEETQNLIDSLISRLPRAERVNKQLGAQYLLGKFKSTKKVHIKDVIEILISESEDNNMALMDNVDTYPLTVKARIFNLFGHSVDFQKSAYFYEVMFGTKSVMVPATTGVFYNEERETHRIFLATGFMKELLTFAKGCTELDNNGTTYTVPDSFIGEGEKLEAVIQGRLLGKNFGYIESYGSYQVMLNLVGATLSRDEMRVTNLDMFREEGESHKKQVLSVNGCKHPAYFQDSFAGYDLVQQHFTSDIVNFAMEKAVFLSTYTIMILENDVDGDTQQISRDGYQMPRFKGPSASFNGVEFKKFVNGEQESSSIFHKDVAVLRSTMPEFHDALYAAAEAKANIGMFTAVKYKYEATLQGVDTFTGLDGIEYSLSADDKFMITNTLSRLCQTEAMDNVKQVGVDGRKESFIMELAAPHNFTPTFLRSGETVESVRADRMAILIGRLNRVFTDWNVPTDFAVKMVQAMAYAAINLKSNGALALSIFSNRTNEKRFNEVINNLSEGTDSHEFNLKGSFSGLEGSADTGSVYAYLLKALVAVK